MNLDCYSIDPLSAPSVRVTKVNNLRLSPLLLDINKF